MVIRSEVVFVNGSGNGSLTDNYVIITIVVVNIVMTLVNEFRSIMLLHASVLSYTNRIRCIIQSYCNVLFTCAKTWITMHVKVYKTVYLLFVIVVVQY